VVISENGVVIGVGGSSPADDVSLDVWSADQRTDLLSEVLGRPVRVEEI